MSLLPLYRIEREKRHCCVLNACCRVRIPRLRPGRAVGVDNPPIRPARQTSSPREANGLPRRRCPSFAPATTDRSSQAFVPPHPVARQTACARRRCFSAPAHRTRDRHRRARMPKAKGADTPETDGQGKRKTTTPPPAMPPKKTAETKKEAPLPDRSDACFRITLLSV